MSSEKEVVPLTKKINPNAANVCSHRSFKSDISLQIFVKTNLVLCRQQGLVEKWLKEVQTIMLESMLAQTRMAYDSYWNAIRKDWLAKWPGQVVQTVTRMTWTKDVINVNYTATIAIVTQCDAYFRSRTQLLAVN